MKNKEPTYCAGCSFKCQATECDCTCHDKMREYWAKKEKSGEKMLNKRKEEELMKEIKKEHEHLEKTGIPRCNKCHKNMVNGIDSVTKKISKYIWEYDCDCYPKKFRLMMV